MHPIAQTMDLLEGVKINIKVKSIKVTRLQGMLTRNFKHLNLDFQIHERGKKLKEGVSFNIYKPMATICTIIKPYQQFDH